MNDASPEMMSIFCAALEHVAGAERAAYVEGACGQDVELRTRIEALLHAHEQAGGFLPEKAEGRDTPTTVEEPSRGQRPGTVIGPYRLVQEIGEGGMGSVWLAQQQEPIKRLVALKVIKPGMDTKQVVARFEAERQALALMDHPNIARVFDGGTTAGRPYFVMELVKGVPMTRYCDEQRLSPRRRLELFVSTCQAVQHAHQKGIIHRDLKPSNVLIALYDGQPVPKVIDFGVAKAAGAQLTDKTLVTTFGALIGTLEYLSPEQAELNNLDVDTRSDVYSLGVLLYELLTGNTPLGRERVKGLGLLESLRIIREEETARPSTRLSTADELPAVASCRGMEPKRLSRLLRGELDWIVMKALEKDRSRRYQTANDLAMDVGRYLNDEPVLACPPSTAYRLGKFARRNRGPVLAAALVLLALLVGMGGTTFGLVRAIGERNEKQVALEGKEKALDAVVVEQGKTKAAMVRVAAGEKRTREAYDRLTSQVIDEWLSGQPKLTAEQKRFLTETLARYEEFTKESGDTPEQRAALARAYRRVAGIRERLGMKTAAAADLERSIEIWRSLREGDPDDQTYADALAEALDRLGSVFGNLDEPGKALKAYHEARKLLEELLKKHPGTERYVVLLGGTYCNLGIAYFEELKQLQALDWLDRSIRTLQGVPRRNLTGREFLANAHGARGGALVMLHRREEAMRAEEVARDLRKELFEANPNRPRNVEALVSSYQDLGDQQRDQEALTSHLTARALLERLVLLYPSVPDYLTKLARAHHAISFRQVALGDRAGAVKSREEACKVREKLVDLHPDQLDYRQSLGADYCTWGKFLDRAGKVDDAMTKLKKAIVILEPLVARKPKVEQADVALAQSHRALGAILERNRRLDDAIVHYRKAAAAWPDSFDAHFDLGNALKDKGDVNGAIAAFRRAVSLGEKRLERATLEARHHSNLGMALNNLATRLMSRGELREARQLLERAIRHQWAAIKLDRKQSRYRTYLRNHYWSLGATLVGSRDHAGAAEAANELPRIFPDRWQGCHDAAVLLADCVLVARMDAKLSEEKRKEVAQSYAGRAVALLGQAVARGYRNSNNLRTDPTWRPLRSRDDFQELLKQLDAEPKKDSGDKQQFD